MDWDDALDDEAQAKQQLTPVVWVLYKMRACNLYLDGTVWRPHFFWWHPVTWIFILITFSFTLGYHLADLLKELLPDFWWAIHVPKNMRKKALKRSS